MTIDEIKNVLKRSATIFETGGMRPTKDIGESWIGRVGYRLTREGLPLDANGKPMFPVAMFFLGKLPYVPSPLQGIEMLCVYLSESIYDHLVDEDFEGFIEIREYKPFAGLQECEWTSQHIKPFPLTAKLVEDDYPVWDGFDIPSNVADEILQLESKENIEYHNDIAESDYSMHKIGGYGAFCQSGISFGDDYVFVLQISSDEKACFNIVDGGSFYFYRKYNANDWKVHCDFF